VASAQLEIQEYSAITSHWVNNMALVRSVDNVYILPLSVKFIAKYAGVISSRACVDRVS